MKMKHTIICFLLAGLTSSLFANQNITLEDIYKSYKFYPNSIDRIESMQDGAHYTVLEKGMSIDKYAYEDGSLIGTIFKLEDQIDGAKRIYSYAFSSDEKRLLIATHKEQVYRHSFLAFYHIVDLESGKVSPIFPEQKQSLAVLSPNGQAVAFVMQNNLYYYDIGTGKAQQVSFDGKRNEIINGMPDWVYEEEFTLDRGFQWSPDGKKIAFYRFDESHVKEFNMTMYGELYPEWYKFKYPKAGEENSIVSIQVHDVETGKTTIMKTGAETDIYFPRIKWTADPNKLCITRLNRLQNHVELLIANVESGDCETFYQETNERFLSEFTDDFVHFMKDNKHALVMSEKSGFMHFYMHNLETKDIKAVTKGKWMIDQLLGIDEQNKRIYYTSTEVSPIDRMVYSIGFDGKDKTQLSASEGWNTAYFSSSYEYYIHAHSDANTPPLFTLHNQEGKMIRSLENNADFQSTMQEYNFLEKELITIKNKDGLELNAYQIKPDNFDPNKKHPVLMYVYGGPESQLVTNRWDYRIAWFQMLAQQGYLVVCVDNQGTDGRGEDFAKSTYMQLGKKETEDQIAAAEWLAKQSYVDAERIGIFGWSYGGYMSLLCLMKGSHIFKMAISVAPVTNWRYYDTIYTERFMRTPQENGEGYDQNSPISHVEKMKGKLLLVHGTADDNVHLQNSVELTDRLVEANKQFEMMYYPNKAHGIRGGNTSLHLYTKMTDFIYDNL